MSRGGQLGEVRFRAAALFFVIAFSFSLPATGKRSYSFDLGAYENNVEQRYSAPAGYAREVSSLSPFARLRVAMPLWRKLAFEPSLGSALPWRSGADGFAKTLTFQFNFDCVLPVFSFLKLRFGPGILWLMAVSLGQGVVLDNGTSTSTFYTPGRISNSFLFTTQVGLDLHVWRRFSLGFDIWATAVASSALRRYHAAVSLGVAL